ncbi:glycosyltransferase family 4 protein [Dysgonomonas mossii]|uniref:Glycosyltransferase family 1 protein n=1 Tax=Dysgonomonas mossii TaxID=163665 RepID=A0A4Y9INJ0_9BACT|nr:glycosyltransferase family 1 protein [Dysgonomonas mossii]MBF0760942.1 glycosyltransferase family 4 protein [Dysgonomonas mossii]TFU89901.1 glycosyltransferase family 1 protein [Dysgonomonas mossii]
MFVVNGRYLTQKATGVHRYAFEICNKLHEMGVDFHVAVPNEIHPDYKFSFKVVKCGSLNTHLWEQISLPRYLKRIGSPLLISFTGCGPINYSNQIMTIHDVSHERYPEWFSKNYYRFYHYMMPRIGKKAHAVLTVSEFSKKEIVDTLGINAEKIHVVHSNVPFHNKPSKEEILSFTRNPEAERYILAVSSMDPRKNFIRLVEAFDKIKDKSVKLYIIGMSFKAFNTPDLQKLIGENVHLPGYIPDEKLQTMYQNALLSVYPSLYEGFGLPPLESMTYGCPVINSDIPALREVSQDAALYVDPYNVEDITEKIEQLLVDEPLRKELQEKGLLQIKKYSWDKSAKQVYELAQLFM